jgi:hypothetical protein
MIVLYLYRFRPDSSRSAEFLATLWQGSVPADLRLHRWLYVDRNPREMVLIWEGGEQARQWVERCFGSFGELQAETVTDSTPGLAACLARDLDAFGQWLRERGTGEEEIARQLDVRRRGLAASSPEAAGEAGRAWASEQADLRRAP